MSEVTPKSCPYCYLDFDIDNYRSKLALAAAFVDATDSRYGFSSNDLRLLGGSELARIEDLISSDHEWSDKLDGGIQVRPPSHGCRIIIKLFWNSSPLASENFATLCTNGNTTLKNGKKPKPAPIGDSGKPLTYKNSIIHRLVDQSFVQGGDFVFGNGSGGESIYNGKKFKDERGGISFKHDRKGIVSMGNSGKNSNTSQFFITFKPLPQCDGKHVVFGEVVSGFEVLDALENIGTKQGDGDKPLVPIQITDCGAFTPLYTPGSGYWYDQPDSEAFSGMTPVFMVRPRVAIVAGTNGICDKFLGLLGSKVCPVPVIVDDLGGIEAAVGQVFDLLESFAVDMVIVAPVYADSFKNFQIPTLWLEMTPSFGGKGVSITKEEIIIISKPVEALRKIHSVSYMAKSSTYRLDGAL